MSDDASIESLCREKISLEFEIFYINEKERLGEGRGEEESQEEKELKEKNKQELTAALKTTESELKKTLGLGREEIADLYLQYTQKQEYAVSEGFLRERKKCTYCLRFIHENYAKGTNEYAPCEKIIAQRKLMQLKCKLTDKEKSAIEHWHLECDNEFMPLLEKEELNAELDLLEREHRIIIEAWKKQVYAKIASDNL